MAELVVTQEELALRRRARRRLVGAVAIALTVVVVLPMLFDSEPKPLGPDVDIRIPAQDSPFDTSPVLAPSAADLPAQAVAPTPAPQPAEPTQTPVDTAAPGKPASSAEAAAPKTDQARSVPEAKAVPEAKPESKPVAKPEPKPVEKPALKADSTFASQGYFLQLGAFGNETNARLLLAKAMAAGFNATLLSSNSQFRVRVGPILQHDRALEMQSKLKAKGFSPVLIGP
jgi:DedD protein